MGFFLLAALSAQLSLPSPHRTFGDWVSVCDNGLRCEVSSGMGQAQNIDVHLHLVREPAAGGAVRLRVEPAGGFGKRPFLLLIDGRPTSLSEGGGDLVPSRGGGFPLARALAMARAIAVVHDGERATISTKGLAAALRDMDKRQGRAGTSTALVARGSRPSAAVPAAPPLPVRIERRRPTNGLAIQPSAARLAQWRREGGCDKNVAPGDYPPESWPLDGRTSVILVMCYPGNHNSEVLVRVGRKQDGSDARPALFDFNASLSNDEGPTVPPENPRRDPHTGRLGSGQGGGIAYESTSEEWVWDGARFRLVGRETSYGSEFRARVVRR